MLLFLCYLSLDCKTSTQYRVAHLVADLGWVDLDFECYTVCPILPGLIGIWPKGLVKWVRWWNTEIQVIPTQVGGHMVHPA